MTKMNSPSVSSVTGSVSRIRIGRMTAFTSPSTTAATSAAVKSATTMPGMR